MDARVYMNHAYLITPFIELVLQLIFVLVLSLYTVRQYVVMEARVKVFL